MEGLYEETIVAGDILQACSGGADPHRHARAAVGAAGSDAGTTDIIAPHVGTYHILAGEREAFGRHADCPNDCTD